MARARIPGYRFHKASGQAVVRLNGRSFYLGPWQSPDSKRKYDRLIIEWLASSRRLEAVLKEPELTIDVLVEQYWVHAEAYYVDHQTGGPAQELGNIRHAIRHLTRLYGQTLAAKFGPVAFRAIQLQMVQDGLARGTIASRLGKIRRIFRWAVAQELVPPGIWEAIKAVAPLRPHQHGVKETPPVRAVAVEAVRACWPFCSVPIRAMIEVQVLTGMRPGEVMALRPRDLDRSGDVWIYRPGRHKTQSRGFGRAIAIGPKAQKLLEPWLDRDPGRCCFTPAEAVEIRNRVARQNRRSPMTPSQAARGSKPNPKRVARDHYDRWTYCTAIERACDRAFPHPTLGAKPKERLSEAEAGELLAWRKEHRWHPNQLRHATATEVRKLFGLESAQVVLGHQKADVTQIYAERDLQKAVEVMRQIG